MAATTHKTLRDHVTYANKRLTDFGSSTRFEMHRHTGHCSVDYLTNDEQTVERYTLGVGSPSKCIARVNEHYAITLAAVLDELKCRHCGKLP